MSTIEETIKARERAMLPTRLVRGATVLGELWRGGVRCLGEWSRICPCAAGSGETDFCAAKRRWVGILVELCGGPPYVTPWNAPHALSGNESFFVLEAMSRRMIEATGLTLRIATPGERALLRVGPKGTDFGTLLDLAAIPDGPDQDAALEAVVKIQTVMV